MRPFQAILHPAHRSGRCLDQMLERTGASSGLAALHDYQAAVFLEPWLGTGRHSLSCALNHCTSASWLSPFSGGGPQVLENLSNMPTALQRWMAGWGCSFRCVWLLCLTIRPYCADTSRATVSLGAGGEGGVRPSNLGQNRAAGGGLRDLCPFLAFLALPSSLCTALPP